MKDNLRRLKVLLELLGYDNFYSVSCDNYLVNLQGEYHPTVILKARKLKFTFSINEVGNTIALRSGYRIVLTESIQAKL